MGRFFSIKISAKRLIISLLVVFVVLKISSFGWKFSGVSDLSLTSEDLKIADNLEQTVKYISDTIGIRDYISYKKLSLCAQFIDDSFKELGYEIDVMEYEVGNQIFKNIIAIQRGGIRKGKTIIIGAHYDSCSNPGADDNASGIAGLLELARLFRLEELKSDVKFIAFVNEEPPFFMSEDMGSRVYVREAKKENEPIVAVVILESIGYYTDALNSQDYPPPFGLFYPNRGNFITFVSNFASGQLLRRMSRAFRKKSEFPLECFVGPGFIPGVNFSDHWSFWRGGYPAVMITDTAYLRNPNYHMQTDTYQTLDYKKMALVVKGLKQVLIELLQ